VQQSALAWQIAPRSRHSTGCGLVAPGWTYVVFDELKHATDTSPTMARTRQRGADGMMLGKSKTRTTPMLVLRV
jgi:hypothetical protein